VTGDSRVALLGRVAAHTLLSVEALMCRCGVRGRKERLLFAVMS
jgi:hypothetical protein